MKNLTWQNPEQLFVAQELINKVKSKCCGIKDNKLNLRFSEEAEKKLTSLPWYGNIRELQHAIEKAVILSDGGMISAEDIDGGNQQRKEKPLEEVQTLDEMESRMIEKTIRECEGNLSVVAARLGISRQTLYNKIKRYGL